jgi:hypothetical protein
MIHTGPQLKKYNYAILLERKLSTNLNGITFQKTFILRLKQYNFLAMSVWVDVNMAAMKQSDTVATLTNFHFRTWFISCHSRKQTPRMYGAI